MNKKELHIVTGMTKDLTASQFSREMVYDARNIRITARGENSTLLAVTNEKGPADVTTTGDSLQGTVLGTAVFTNTIVVFTTNVEFIDEQEVKVDRIYRINFNSTFSSAVVTTLFSGELEFDEDYPIEALPFYETDSIKKVYWIDGKNQPRVINIENGLEENGDKFNFVNKISTNAEIDVKKINSGGEFPSGMIQYCFSYFNKFAQESAVVCTSPMYYLSPQDIGLPADGKANISFNIDLTKLDSHFEYVRLYAILSTSENSIQSVRIVGDYKIQSIHTINKSTIEDIQLVLIPDASSWYGAGPYENLCVKNIVTNEVLYTIDSVFDSLEDFTGYGGLPDTKEFIQKPDLRLCTSTSNGDIILVTEKEAESPYEIVNPDCWEEPMVIAKRNNSFYVFGYEADEQAATTKELTTAELTEEGAKEIYVVDNGLIGSSVDKNLLLYLGGTKIIPQTMTTKDNTLFFGNIKEASVSIGDLQITETEKLADYARHLVVGCTPTHRGPLSNSNSFYDYYINNNRNSSQLKTFKSGESYRLGFIAQDENGKWSDAVWLGDYKETLRPESLLFDFDINGKQQEGTTNVGFYAEIPVEVTSTLVANGYKRIAPVVVYPSFSDRLIICQGILSGTVYNVDDRSNKSPFVQADWRFRDGYSWKIINKEIQLNSWMEWIKKDGGTTTIYKDAPTYPGININDSSNLKFTDYFKEYFYRDPSILTFHSPDIEFNDDILNSDFNNVSMYIVGMSSGRYLRSGATVTAMPPQKEVAISAFTSTAGYLAWASTLKNEKDKDSLLFAGYEDAPLIYNNHVWQFDTANRAFRWNTYLWHRHGSLNNYAEWRQGTSEMSGLPVSPGKLKNKCISEISYARTTFFDDTTKDVLVETALPKLFIGNSQTVNIDYNGDKVSYYGDIDKILIPGMSDNSGLVGNNSTYFPSGEYESMRGVNKSAGYYPIFAAENGAIIDVDNPNTENYDDYNTNPLRLISSITSDPVHIKYKSTKHLVVPLKSDTALYNFGESSVSNVKYAAGSNNHLFWAEDAQKDITSINPLEEYMGAGNVWPTDCSIYIAEFRRNFDDTRMNSRFSGNTKEALAHNDWVVCGFVEPIRSIEGVSIGFNEGDTYVGRYDCLKTYPATQEDENSIVSIYSTELESRVNLDLRYDRNRGLKDNTLVTPENFNLFNRPGYEQTNRFFTYHSLDYDRYKSLNHPNMLTWSLEKTVGSDIDIWTSIPLMSTADLQGDLGEITALTTYNDNIFAFQNNGFAQILFNERVQIPTSDGQPIEITNGLKYGGVRYLSKHTGLINKWSLCTTKNGMYFVDDSSRSLYRFTSQLEDLSTSAGMSVWAYAKSSMSKWHPVSFDNIRTYYDKVNNDVYFSGLDTLVFSETLNKFISFMDYSKLGAMFNAGNKFFTLWTNQTDTPHPIEFKEMWAGDYMDNYSLTFISNDGNINDKIFNNLEWVNTVYDKNGNYEPLETFNWLKVWNDYQDTGRTRLKTTDGKAENLRKKFNVFRALVPRDRSANFPPYSDRSRNIINRSRIRSPWAYIKLEHTGTKKERMEFQNLVVDYFE